MYRVDSDHSPSFSIICIGQDLDGGSLMVSVTRALAVLSVDVQDDD